MALGSGALDALADWLAVRGEAPGAVLCAVANGGRVHVQSITPEALHTALRRLAVAAGVAAFTSHDLRRSYISDLLDAGADLATVQRIVGHASPDTTSRYDRRGDDAKRRAAGMLHVPYGRAA